MENTSCCPLWHLMDTPTTETDGQREITEKLSNNLWHFDGNTFAAVAIVIAIQPQASAWKLLYLLLLVSATSVVCCRSFHGNWRKNAGAQVKMHLMFPEAAEEAGSEVCMSSMSSNSKPWLKTPRIKRQRREKPELYQQENQWKKMRWLIDMWALAQSPKSAAHQWKRA